MIDLLGSLAVLSMAVCYALEDRGPAFTLGLSAACGASAGYAVVIGSWPFAAVETLWALIALRKGMARWKRSPIRP